MLGSSKTQLLAMASPQVERDPVRGDRDDAVGENTDTVAAVMMIFPEHAAISGSDRDGIRPSNLHDTDGEGRRGEPQAMSSGQRMAVPPPG